jgi:hypothetical protein
MLTLEWALANMCLLFQVSIFALTVFIAPHLAIVLELRCVISQTGHRCWTQLEWVSVTKTPSIDLNVESEPVCGSAPGHAGW